MNKYIKIDFLYIAGILNLFSTYISLSYVTNYRTIKAALMIIIAGYLITQTNELFKCRQKGFVFLVFLLCAIVLGTAIVYKSDYTSRNIVYSALEFVVPLIENFLILKLSIFRGMLSSILKSYCEILAVLLVVNDFFAFTTGIRNSTYFLGSKFFVVYVHLFWFALYFYLNQYSKYRLYTLVLIGIYMIVLSTRISCATGIVGTVFFMILYLGFAYKHTVLENPRVYFLVLLLSSTFVISYDLLLNSEFIQNLVTNYLGRSLTLTGRVNIYEVLPIILGQRFWFGYGYGTTYDVYTYYTGYANSQNGMIEWMSQIGLVGICVLISFFAYILSYNYKTEFNMKRIFPVVVFIYVMTLISTVEISINRLFFGALAIIWATALEMRLEHEKN